MTVFFPLLLLICTLSTVRLQINSDSKITPLLNRGMETTQTSDPEQTCKPDINSVLREMSALLAELKAEIRHLQKENEAQAAKVRELELQKTELDKLKEQHQVLMNNIQQNVSGRRLCTLLEGIYQSLMEMSTELTLRAEAEAHVMGSLYHSTSQRGRPRYNIPATQLTDMRDLGFSWMAISQMLSVNVRTLYNHRIQLGLVDYGTFNNISNVDLDHLITEILTHTPGSGESYISGSLRGRGIRVQRWRVRTFKNS
ncbi:uncharacterized protein LOC120435224 [Oreochromis aureus]|uniref:uncharacterized protein LOC120435224 n=1 Tax=Oreochromis aureus TaxID=47969 RepID=UPI001954A339|nr:uncharacterized protein LOC120435224 [Oreochromis aureus]